MSTVERRTLAAIVVCGTVLRLLPASYGLPLVFHADETYLLQQLAKFLKSASQGLPTIGASTFYYPLTAVYGLYFVYGRATGRFGSMADFETAFVLDDPTLHLLGRLQSVAFSAAALIALYVLGRKLYGHRGGLIASTLMAASVIDISSSHWLKFDSAVVFMSLLAVLAVLGLKDRGQFRRRYLVAGLVIGLAIAGRIDLLVLVPLLVVAHVVFARPAGVREALGVTLQGRLIAALAMAVGVYLLVSFALVDAVLQRLFGAQRPFTTREMGASLLQFAMAGDVLMSLRHNIPFYLLTVLVGTCGLALTVAMALGMVRLLRSYRSEETVLLVFLALVAAPTLLFNVYGTHYFLRVLPLLMILAAGGVLWLSGRLERAAGRHAWIVVLALMAAQPAWHSVQYVRYLRSNVDTRARAREWLYREVPFGETIAVQKFHELPAYLPPLNESPDHIERKLAAVRASGLSSGLAFAAHLQRPVPDAYRIVNLSGQSYWADASGSLENLYDFDGLRARGVTHVVTSGFNTLLPVNDDGSPIGILLADRAIDRVSVARYDAFNARLRQEASLVAEFTTRNARIARLTDAPIDPTVRIYRLN